MKHLKFAVLAAGLLGLISIFALPLMKAGPLSMTMWDVRIIDPGQVYITLAAFAVPAILAGLAIARGGMARWQAIIATVFFALGVVKCRENMSLATGGKVMLIAAVLGLVVAIVATVKPSAPAR